MMHLTAENTVQDYEKKVYIQQYFKFIVRKLEIRPVPLFYFLFFSTHAHPQLPLSKFISYSMFNLVLLHFSDWEVCNVYKSRGNTTAACKHVTSYFLFFFFFFSFFKTVLVFVLSPPPFRLFSILWMKATARGRRRAWILMLVKEQTWGLLGVELKLGPVSRRLDNERVKFRRWASAAAAAARNHSRQSGSQLRSLAD